MSNTFTIATAEESAILKQEPLGDPMNVDEFCTAFSLSTSIKDVMTELEVNSPDIQRSIPFELYMEPKNKHGFALKVGAAVKLKKAMIAWVQGTK